MNLKYMKVSLFEITYKKKGLFHDILIYWDEPVYKKRNIFLHMNMKANIPIIMKIGFLYVFNAAHGIFFNNKGCLTHDMQVSISPF